MTNNLLEREEFSALDEKITPQRRTLLILWAADKRRGKYDNSIEYRNKVKIRIRAAGGICELCRKKSDKLDAHHNSSQAYINYSTASEKFDDFDVLCVKCHKNQTKKLPWLNRHAIKESENKIGDYAFLL